MNCEQVRNLDLVDKYVTGQGTDEELDEFEEHYFSCSGCLELVQVTQAIQSGSASPPTAPVAAPKAVPKPPPPQQQPPDSVAGWFSQSYALVAGVGAAVLLLSIAGWRWLGSDSDEPRPAPDPVEAAPVIPSNSPAKKAGKPANQPLPPPLPVPADAVKRLAALGEFSPPAYREGVVRDTPDDASERFRKAIDGYQKGEYTNAASELSHIPLSVPGSGSAAEDHAMDAGIAYYLGISQLMLTQNDAGVRSLEKAAAYGPTPFVEASRFYMAKGLIRQKQFAEAARQLRLVSDRNGEMARPARELLNELSKLL